jgi:hypothetical protein
MGPADRRQRMGESSTATAEAFLKRTRHWRRVPSLGRKQLAMYSVRGSSCVS